MNRSTLSRTTARIAVVAAVFGWTLAPFAAESALAFPGESSAAGAPGDPVIAEVARLLEAGLGEPLVLRWLDESGRIPGRPTADELVALKKAGASDQLIAALLDRARAARPESATSPRATPAAAVSPATSAAPPASVAPVATSATSATSAGAPAAVPASPPPSATPVPPAAAASAASASSAPSPATPSGAGVIVDSALRYVHVPDEGEPWDLVVYLDGKPFDPVPAAPTSSDAGTWTRQTQLAPGRHLLAWAQESHRLNPSDRSRADRDVARFDPEPLAFDLAPGAPATIEFEYRDRTGLFLRMGGPVTVRVAQAGSELASRNSSGDPASWPLLCEEIEANLGGNKPRLVDRQRLRDCVRWADLWTGVSGVPIRDAVRPKAK